MEEPDYNELDDMLAELETAYQTIEDAPISAQDENQQEQYDQQQPQNGEYQSEYYEETYAYEEQQYQDPSSNAGSYQQEEPIEVQEEYTNQQDIAPPPVPEQEVETQPQNEPEPEPVVEVVAPPKRPPPVPMKRANSQPNMLQEEPPSRPPVAPAESTPDLSTRPNKPLPVPVKKETPKPPPKPAQLDNTATTPTSTPPQSPRPSTTSTQPSTSQQPARPPPKPAPVPVTRTLSAESAPKAQPPLPRNPSNETAPKSPVTRVPSSDTPPKSQPPVPQKRSTPTPPSKPKPQEQQPAEPAPAPVQEVEPQPAPVEEPPVVVEQYETQAQPVETQAQPVETQPIASQPSAEEAQNNDLEQRQRDLEERKRRLEEKKKNMASLRRSTSIDSPPGSPSFERVQNEPSPSSSPPQTSFGARPTKGTLRGSTELGRARSLVIDPEALKNSFAEQSSHNQPRQTPPPSLQTPPPSLQTPPPSLQTPPPSLQTPPPSLQTPPTQTTPPPYQPTPQQTPPPYQATPPPYQPPQQQTPPPYHAVHSPSSSATLRHTPPVPQNLPPRRTQMSMDSIPLAALAALQQPAPLTTPSPAPVVQQPPMLIALYNYKARGTTFSTGDVDLDMSINDTMIFVMDLKNGWMRVNMKGRVGLVPASYVRPYQPNTVATPARPAPVPQPATTPAPVATPAPATGATTPGASPSIPARPHRPTSERGAPISPIPARVPPAVSPRPPVRTEDDSSTATAPPSLVTPPVGTPASTPPAVSPAETPNASPAPSPAPRRPAPAVPERGSPGVSPAPSPTPARAITPGRLQPSQSYPSPAPGSGTPVGSPGKVSNVSDIRNKIGANINLGAFKGAAPPGIKKLPSMGAIPLPKVQEPIEELPRGRLRFARLVVSYLDLQNTPQQVEKKFPVVTAVSHVTGWCAKQLFGGSASNQPKEAFGLYFNNKILDPEKPLACFHNLFNLREPIQVELRKVKLEEVLCRISTKEQDVSVTLKVTQFTSVWFVLMQTMKKVQTKPGEMPEYYRLYFETTNEELDETELMFAYKDKLNERIICGMRAQLPGENHKLNCIYNELYSFDINPNSATETLLRKLLKQEVVKRAHEAVHPLDLYMEFSNSSIGEQNDDDNESSGEEEEILDEYAPFSSYNRLFEQNLVEVKRRSRPYTIELDGIPYILALDRNTTVEDVLKLIEYNVPDVLQGNPITEFTLIVGETPLLWDRTVQSYDIKDESLAFRRKPKPIVVFLGEKSQSTIEVDFTIHVAKLLPMIFRAFNMTVPKKETDFTLRRLSPDAPIEMTRSLAGQNVPMNATLILKMVDKQPVRVLTRNESDPSLGPNIYDEEANATTVLWDNEEPNVLRAGTLNKLVEFITNPQTDIEFMKGFLMTYQSFTTPPKLLRKLIERFNVPLPTASSDDYDNFDKGVKRPIQLRVCSTLKHWMENHWQDFDHELTQQLVDFTDQLPHEEATIANQLRQAILKRTCGMKTRSRAGVIFTKNFPEPILKVPKKSAGEAIHILDYDELEIARQLSLIEFEYYQKVLPTEFLGQCWSKQETQHLAPNLLNMIARSTSLSLWISNMIVDPARVKTRAQRFTKLIKIAENLRKLNNFSTLMAFLGAFNNASVSRLRFTKALIPKKQQDTLAELETVMSVEGSSKNYRQALRSSNPPCIPYIGTYLSDLTFIDDGNKNNITEHNLINFGKRMLTHRVISEIQRYQQVGYSFQSVAQIVSHVKDLGIQDEKTFSSQMYEKSLAREPRGAEKVV